MAVVAGLIRARRNKTGPALPAARALPARVVADLLCAGSTSECPPEAKTRIRDFARHARYLGPAPLRARTGSLGIDRSRGMLGGVEVAAERFADQFARCRSLGLGTGHKLLL
jgi:hypothetical protein